MLNKKQREGRRKDDFSVRIMTYRIECGISQVSLASALGVTQSQLSKWENAKHYPSKLRREKIWKFLNTAV